MTTHNPPHPDDDYRRPVDPLRPDQLRCDCGATAERDRRCRKCRARVVWARRTAGRRLRVDRPPSRRRTPRSGRDDRTHR